MEAFGLLLHGFTVLLTWKTLVLMMVGLILGIFVGVLPGLGGPNGVAILLPLTFTMDPTSAIVMLSCIYWGALFGGAITSILFNIPGEAWSVATTFDGYPMAQQGKAAEALTAAFTSSFIGSLFAGRADHVSRTRHRLLCPQIWPAGILRGLICSPCCPFVGLGREAKHKTIISMALGLFAGRRRHGHRLRYIAHDLRPERTAARHQLPGRCDRPVASAKSYSPWRSGSRCAVTPRASACGCCGRCGRTCRNTG